jgi:hypothetical protein
MATQLQKAGDKASRVQELIDEEQEEFRTRNKTIELGGPHSPGRQDGRVFNAEVRFLLKSSLEIKDDGSLTIRIPQWVRISLHGSSDLPPEFTNDLTLGNAVRRLTPRFQAVLIQRFIYGKQWKDMANEMHYDERVVRDFETRAFRELRRIICND